MAGTRTFLSALTVGAAVLGLCFAGPTAGKGTQGKVKHRAFGAIAYHRDSGSVGYSYDFGSSREARTEALRQCGDPKCEVILGFRSTCAALAKGPKKSEAITGTTRQEAEAKALRKCGGKGCEIIAWACTK